MATTAGGTGDRYGRAMTDVDHTAIYRGVRLRISELALQLDDARLDAIAPATPTWRVRDVIAHLGGATADMVAGNLEGVASDAWTQAQVDARLDWPITKVIDEWTRCAEVVEPMIADIPAQMRAMLTIDAISHEHDVRGAVDRPGARDGEGIAFAATSIARGLHAQRGDEPAITLILDGEQVVLGQGTPHTTVTTTAFELVRAGVGRRSLEQIEAWTWQGPADPEAMVLGRFSPPRTDPLLE
jgi:uncharacterized protein (TIGR03083 family)